MSRRNPDQQPKSSRRQAGSLVYNLDQLNAASAKDVSMSVSSTATFSRSQHPEPEVARDPGREPGDRRRDPHREEEREREHEHQGECATRDRADVLPVMNWAGDLVSTRRSTSPSARSISRPKNPPATYPYEAAQHAAQPVGRHSEPPGGPEAHGGAEHHDAEVDSSTNIVSLVDADRPPEFPRAPGRGTQPASGRPQPVGGSHRRLTSGRERIVPMRR